MKPNQLQGGGEETYRANSGNILGYEHAAPAVDTGGRGVGGLVRGGCWTSSYEKIVICCGARFYRTTLRGGDTVERFRSVSVKLGRRARERGPGSFA